MTGDAGSPVQNFEVFVVVQRSRLFSPGLCANAYRGSGIARRVQNDGGILEAWR